MNKKKLIIVLITIMLIVVGIILLVNFKKEDNEKPEGNNNLSKEEIPAPTAPSENTESLIENLEKVEDVTINNDTIEFSNNTSVKTGEKVAVWIYSTPKFLGYFDVIIENGTKMIKGLDEAMKNINIEPGKHNIAISTEKGEDIGYIEVYVEENKLFENENAAVISKYTTKEITEEIEIKYQTETKKDSNKKNGTKEIVQKGVNGLSKITYKVTYDENGNEISREKIDEQIIKNAIKEVVIIGTATNNTLKIVGEFVGFMCKEEETITNDGVKACNDSLALPSFKAIMISNNLNYVVYIDGVKVNPIRISIIDSLYKGTYNGNTYYFEPRGGGPEDITLTPELCKEYNLDCNL